MFCPNDCYVRATTLRIRPVPELDCCFVFTPARPNLYTLNATAWLVLELCDGQDGRSLEAAYRSAVEAGDDDALIASELRSIIEDFEAKGIVERRARQRIDRSGRREAGRGDRRQQPVNERGSR